MTNGANEADKEVDSEKSEVIYSQPLSPAMCRQERMVSPRNLVISFEQKEDERLKSMQKKREIEMKKIQ